MAGQRLVVIGAGPVGLTAALLGASRGLDVTVLERGQVGESLLRWGTTRAFTPASMNIAPIAAAQLRSALPPGDALMTGAELALEVLAPLAECDLLRGRVLCGQEVLAVGRAGLLRGDYADHPVRAERPFRLLVSSGGVERTLEADFVIDASGTYGQPLPTGAGGLPAPGERAFSSQILRDLGALQGALPGLAGKHVLLVGGGHSAANALLRLQTLQGGARVTWALRAGNQRPVAEVASDPLPERARVVSEANALAKSPPPWLTVLRRCSVEGFAPGAERAVLVSLSGQRSVEVDTVVSLTGYRPDLAPLSALALEISPATEGAARLSRALSSVTDCLSVPALGERDLFSGEPGFYLAGAKSYGRARTFLLQTGYAQLEAIVGQLRGKQT